MLLRSCCCCTYSHAASASPSLSGVAPETRSSARQVIAGGVVVSGADLVDGVGGDRRRQSSSKRRRATYRYQVVYRREEFSHDYLDGSQVFTPDDVVVDHPQTLAAPQLASVAPAIGDRSPDYSHLSNYGYLGELGRCAAGVGGLGSGWRPEQQHLGAARGMGSDIKKKEDYLR